MSATYLLIDLAFLAPVVVLAVVATAVSRGPRWRAVGLAALVLIALTAVFDNVIVGLGIVAYDPARILGLRVGVAPVEDFAYAVAAVLLLPLLWRLLPDSRQADARTRARLDARYDAEGRDRYGAPRPPRRDPW
ncbi:MAG: lycopene cyclase domain-containing protein [Micrococcales bacterium]|nr:lycopene cyclase domain-containing protein [Micrococcales bacterium]